MLNAWTIAPPVRRAWQVPAPRPAFSPPPLREGPCGGVAKRGEAGASPDGGRILTGREHQPGWLARGAGLAVVQGLAPGWLWCRARRARVAAQSGRRDVGEISGRGRRDKREVYSGPEPAAQATTQVGEFSPGVVLCGPAAPV